MLSVAKIKERIYPMCTKHGIRTAILFGSYSKGLASNKSDVDILVDSGLRGLRFVGLVQDLLQVLGVDVDVIDVAHISANSPLAKEIEATGITIFP